MKKLIYLLLVLGCGSVQAQQIPCPTSSYTVSGSEENTITCYIDPSLNIDAGGVLTNMSSGTLIYKGYDPTYINNDGTLNNLGVITSGTEFSSGLINEGTINNSGTINILSLTNNSLLNNTGSIRSLPNGLIGNSADLINSGTIYFTSSSWVTNYIGGTITNNSGGTYTSHSFTTNHGTILNDGDYFDYQRLTNAVSGTLTNNGTMTRQGQAPLTNDGTWVNNGAFTGNWSDSINNGSLSNTGTMNNTLLRNAGVFINSGAFNGAVINNGDLLNTTEGMLNFESAVLSNSGTLTNDGTVINTADVVTNSGTFTNNGTLILDNGLSNNGTFTNTGSVTAGDVDVGAGGTVSIFGGTLDANTINMNGGTFSLTGGVLNVDNFNGDLANTGGTVGPGHSPGITAVTGNYSQDANSALLIEIGGLIAGTEYDVLNVGGEATLAGTLDAILYDLGGGVFGPTLGDTFDILEAESIVGGFDTLSLTTLDQGLLWDIDYLIDFDGGTTDIVRLTVSAVPIPAAAWLFGSGLGLLGFLRRRKQS